MASWTAHIEGGPKRVNHAAVCIDGYIYSFGGYCTGDDFGVRQDIDIHVYNTASYKWDKIEYAGNKDEIPYQRYGHTAVGFGQYCIIYGGRNDINGVSEHVYTFDVVSRCWHRPKVTGTLPLARDGHSCCVVGNCMYLFGGFEEESMEFSNTVYSLNLTTFRWSFCLASGEEPIWRDFHSATAWRDYMIVFGGRSDEAGPIHSAQELYDDTIYMFDTRNNRWSVPKVTGPLPVGRRSHCAFEHKDRLYIFGGFNSNLGTHYNDIYMYNIKKKRWSPFKVGGRLPRIRRRSCCCKDGNSIFIFGGTSPDTSKSHLQSLTDLSDLHVLDMAPSLRTLCLMAVLEHKIRYEGVLPASLTCELHILSKAGASRLVPSG